MVYTTLHFCYYSLLLYFSAPEDVHIFSVGTILIVVFKFDIVTVDEGTVFKFGLRVIFNWLVLLFIPEFFPFKQIALLLLGIEITSPIESGAKLTYDESKWFSS